MTDEQRLAEIRSRAEAATPGPWQSECEGDLVTAGPLSLTLADFTWRRKPNPADAPFVAHARDDIPWLLDLVQQQARVIADLAEESDAARLAMRYREALEKIADLNIHKEGLKPAQFRIYALDAEKMQHVAREALEGKS